MKERPIIFSSESVRAILAGAKTQTRRVYKPRNPEPWELPPGEGYLANGTPWPMRQDEYGDFWPIPCPYGAPGDRLWVKETWQPAWDEDEYAVIAYRADGAVVKPKVPLYAGLRFFEAAEAWTDESPWRSPLMMPRWASRLTLEVVSVRVERLHEIQEDDARAEGVTYPACEEFEPVTHRFDAAGRLDANGTRTLTVGPARCTFERGWDALNAKRGFGWDTNPWVWVVTFRRASDTDTTAPTRQKGE